MIKRSSIIFVCGLFLAGSLTAQPVPPAVANSVVYNVREFGAVGDGKTLDSPAINKAIEVCAQTGGGTVYLPPGTYLSGSIHLKSNIHLYLDAGATILGAPQELNAYDPPEPFEGIAYQDGGHTYFHNSLIWGEDLVDVSITGRGMINGGGLTRQDKPVGGGSIGLGDKAIALKRCRSVLIRDITIFHGGHFAIIATGCHNMNIDNVTIDTNRDGINLDACTNVTVANSRINAPFDDALCPKSSFALGKSVITENITIVNCQVSGFEEGTLLDGTMKPSRVKNGRIKFGTESNGGFRNIVISNVTFRECRGLALEMVDGGIMENISISNITMMEVDDYPIYITLGRRNRGPDSLTIGTVRNIFISNVIATGIDTMSGVHITGLPGFPVENVRLQNIWLSYKGGGTKEHAERVPPELDKGYPEPRRIGFTPAYGVFARHVKGLELSDIRLDFVNEDLRPPLVCIDVEGLEIDNFKARVAKGVKPARFDDVKGLVIRNSPVLGK
ncbi:MAG: glycoside hydrolase family 28 protein [Ignavibacteriales bacterium]|nr:glycoside hydrolase family 28 protein [Ignavibacteriales bacterium]